MDNDVLYTTGYIDYIQNDIFSSKNIYKSFNNTMENINSIMTDIFISTFDLHPKNKYLFSSITNEGSENVRVDRDTNLVIIKRESTIDVYLTKKSRGYVYNKDMTMHYFKFFINTHNLETGTCIPISPPPPPLQLPILNSTIISNPQPFFNKEFIQELTERLKKIKSE